MLVLETLAHVCFVRSGWNLKAVSVQMHSAVVVFTSFVMWYMNASTPFQCFAKAGSTKCGGGFVSYLRDAMTTCPESCCLDFPPYIVIHRAEGYPPPDTYYVDQVKNTLHQIEALDIPSVCESR